MNIEDRIRSRIEAILLNDARNYAEIRSRAEDDEPFGDEAFEEERNLYQRIINNYRSAVSEVNQLLEESVGSLSGFYRVLENIKEKTSFPEICSRIVDCVLQDFGAEFCGLMFLEPLESDGDAFCVEGVRENRKFVRVHSQSTLLGSVEFEHLVSHLTSESAACLNIPDVYRDARFNALDFPSVVRSLACLPISLNQRTIGALILSNSLPHFFKDNHIRVLKILASIVAHLRYLTSGLIQAATPLYREPLPQSKEDPDIFSIVLLDFERVDNFRRSTPLDKESIRCIRKWLVRFLTSRESILFNSDHELILFLPGTTAENLTARVAGLREAFHRWKLEQGERFRNARMNAGFSTCEEGDDLARVLEVASVVMHPELSGSLDLAAEV